MTKKFRNFISTRPTPDNMAGRSVENLVGQPCRPSGPRVGQPCTKQANNDLSIKRNQPVNKKVALN